MNKGERIIIKDDKGKQYELIRVLDLDTKKVIEDLSALVVKKDRIIKEMAKELALNYGTTEEVMKLFEERCK